jgi:phage major head subunit gpT-like protein
MPNNITPALIGSLTTGLSLAYNTQLYAAVDVSAPFTFQATSTGSEEVYPSLSILPGLREWVGDRQVHALAETAFTIKNRTFEETIEIPRENIEDDKYGMYSVVAGQMGQDAGQLPPTLIANLLKNGTILLGPDGVPFFGSHANYAATGGATTVSNMASGSSPAWYLFDTTKMLKPVIYQRRRPFALTTRFNLQDPSVFDKNVFTWGIDGRCNAGFGLWQLAYMSTQVLNQANLSAAYTAMSALRRPNGTPMGIVPDTLVVPSSLFILGNSLYKNDLVANDWTTPTTLVQNQVQGMFKPIEFRWLN